MARVGVRLRGGARRLAGVRVGVRLRGGGWCLGGVGVREVGMPGRTGVVYLCLGLVPAIIFSAFHCSLIVRYARLDPAPPRRPGSVRHPA
jgi:hypothetical protein